MTTMGYLAVASIAIVALAVINLIYKLGRRLEISEEKKRELAKKLEESAEINLKLINVMMSGGYDKANWEN